jgi:hypothetical protein
MEPHQQSQGRGVVGRHDKSACEGSTGMAHAVGTVAAVVAVAVDLTYETYWLHAWQLRQRAPRPDDLADGSRLVLCLC